MRLFNRKPKEDTGIGPHVVDAWSRPFRIEREVQTSGTVKFCVQWFTTMGRWETTPHGDHDTFDDALEYLNQMMRHAANLKTAKSETVYPQPQDPQP